MFLESLYTDADPGFLRTDDNGACLLVAIAVHRRAVDPSIFSLSTFEKVYQGSTGLLKQTLSGIGEVVAIVNIQLYM